jgi:hypothetical protein
MSLGLKACWHWHVGQSVCKLNLQSVAKVCRWKVPKKKNNNNNGMLKVMKTSFKHRIFNKLSNANTLYSRIASSNFITRLGTQTNMANSNNNTSSQTGTTYHCCVPLCNKDSHYDTNFTDFRQINSNGRNGIIKFGGLLIGEKLPIRVSKCMMQYS